MRIFTIIDGQVKHLNTFVVSEPVFKGGTEFTNYYMSIIPGEGAYIVSDEVFTRVGAGHDVHVFYCGKDGQLISVDSVEFSYANEDLESGSVITDYPRAKALLEKYDVNYNNILLGLDPVNSLFLSFGYNEGGSSYDYLQYLLSGEKDSEILHELTGK